jgi:hypothetical protein
MEGYGRENKRENRKDCKRLLRMNGAICSSE